MKIRILGNRLRLRLSQSEVDKIGRLEPVKEVTDFGENQFQYVLKSHSGSDRILSSFENGSITISVQEDIIRQWANSDTVGFQTDSNDVPFVLVEKDFQCLTVREGEDESDLFHNPNTSC